MACHVKTVLRGVWRCYVWDGVCPAQGEAKAVFGCADGAAMSQIVCGRKRKGMLGFADHTGMSGPECGTPDEMAFQTNKLSLLMLMTLI
eukprot:1161538-Pelagomonas_calceolata.AAC.8